MKSVLAAAVLLVAHVAHAQPPPQKIKLSIDARTEGRAESDTATGRLLDEVRRGLAGIRDVVVVPSSESSRMIWIVAGVRPGFCAASVIVTERYDRETLMVLGIEDDDLAGRMMSLQIVNDHQIFTGADVPDVARRIVATLETGVLARLRVRPPRPQ